MNSEEYKKIAERLEKETEKMTYGTMSVLLQVHEGQVVKVRYTRQDCDAFALEKKK